MSGDEYGISAVNDGSGVLTITTGDGDVIGTTDDGILTYSSEFGTDLLITTGGGAITAGKHGISAENHGSGALTITTGDGDVTGTANDGINAHNSNAGTDLAITTGGAVIGGTYGIYANNGGRGALKITTGDGSATGTANDGINAHNSNAGTDLSITTSGAVTGGGFGIDAYNEGRGVLTISTGDGDVTGTANDGINAHNSNAGTDLTITTGGGAVSGDEYGISAVNDGSGVLTITTGDGDVIGTTDDGILTYSSEFGTDLLITTGGGAITAGKHGISAENHGSGALTITTGDGDVTGTANDGINAHNSNAGTDLAITTGGAVIGGTYGIYANNGGRGALKITTGDGSATGTANDGINAHNSNAGTDLTITTGGAVTGGGFGIDAYNEGRGVLTIATGDGAVTGSTYEGIKAYSTGDITITTGVGAVTGGEHGIYANSLGAGDIMIDVNGDVTGHLDYAISTETALDSHTDIQLYAGTVSAFGRAISNDDGDSDIVAYSGSVILGKIVLNAGDDKLTFDGTADFSGVTLFDGGDDANDADGFIDELRFESTGTDTLAGAHVVNWERVTIGSGAAIGFTDAALTAGLLNVETDGVLDATAGFSLTGHMANAGTVDMGDGAAGDVVAVSGDYVGGGALKVDADFNGDTVDMLTVGGDVTGSTTLVALTDVTQGLFRGSGNDILMVDVSGTSESNAFALLDGQFPVGIVDYDLEQQGQDWYLTRLPGLNSTAAVYEAMPSNLLWFADLPSMAQRMGGRSGAGGSVAYSPRGVTISSQPWVRISGSDVKTSPSTTTSGITDQDHRSWGLEAGVDLPTDGSLVLGALVHVGKATTKVANSMGTGTITSTGYGLGATATWIGASDFYIDAQARFTLVKSDVEASGHRQLLLEDRLSHTYAVSVEAGQRIEVGGGTLVPQVQLTRGRLRSGDLVDSAGNVVSLGGDTSLTSRFGLAYEFTGSTNASFYATGNLLHDFSSSTKVDVNSTPLINVGNRNWLEAGIGGSYMISGTSRIYSEVRYRTALGSSGSGLSAVVGISIRW